MSSLKQRIDAFPTQLVMTVVWIALIIPTLIWWRESILWVSFMSLYAIIMTHWTAHQAWKLERMSHDVQSERDGSEDDSSNSGR